MNGSMKAPSSRAYLVAYPVGREDFGEAMHFSGRKGFRKSYRQRERAFFRMEGGHRVRRQLHGIWKRGIPSDPFLVPPQMILPHGTLFLCMFLPVGKNICGAMRLSSQLLLGIGPANTSQRDMYLGHFILLLA